MSHIYYKLPINFEELVSGREAATCSLGESIAHHVQLIILTKSSEHRYNPDFGSKIWDCDFDMYLNNMQLESKFIHLLQKSITEQEPRLRDIQVRIQIAEVQRQYPINNFSELKKQAIILITAFIIETNERFSFQTQIFLGPLSAY